MTPLNWGFGKPAIASDSAWIVEFDQFWQCCAGAWAQGVKGFLGLAPIAGLRLTASGTGQSPSGFRSTAIWHLLLGSRFTP